MVEISEKAAKVLEILRGEDATLVPAQIAEHDPATFTKGGKSVSPLMIKLSSLGLVDKSKVDMEVEDKDGNKVTRSYTAYTLTNEGKTCEYSIKAAK